MYLGSFSLGSQRVQQRGTSENSQSFYISYIDALDPHGAGEGGALIYIRSSTKYTWESLDHCWLGSPIRQRVYPKGSFERERRDAITWKDCSWEVWKKWRLNKKSESQRLWERTTWVHEGSSWSDQCTILSAWIDQSISKNDVHEQKKNKNGECGNQILLVTSFFLPGFPHLISLPSTLFYECSSIQVLGSHLLWLPHFD